MEFSMEACRLQQPVDWQGHEGSALEVADSPRSLQLLLSAMDAATHYVNADVLLESILSEKSLSGLSLASSQDLSDGPLDHFPCIAEELEQQAKQLEEDWFCPSQPPVALAAQAKAQQSFRLNAAVLGPPALRHSALDLLQRQLALQEEEEQRRLQEQVVKQQERRQQQQAAECRARECTPTPTAAEAAAAPCTREEPCTPQRHSAGDSSWSESPLPGNLEDYAEVQSPAPVKMMALISPAGPSPACPAFGSTEHPQLPPLAAAIHNAQRVRLGQEPDPGAWRGCGRSAWCSQSPRHRGSCTSCATVPGLLAYPSSDLFESGVNIEELCRVPEELIGAGAGAVPLGPDTESEGEGAGAVADCLSSGNKRCRDEAALAEDGEASQSGCGGGGTASSGGTAEAAALKRLRTDACSSASLAAAFSAAVPLPVVAVAAGALQPSPAAVAAAAAEVAAAVCPRMVPVSVPTPMPVPQFAPPVPLPLPSAGAAISRNRGRPAGAPRLRPLPRVETPPAPPLAGPVAHTPSKPVTRQKQQHSPATVATVVPRTSGRRTVLQWHTDSVTDPRTGATVTSVQPGTFCTQCFALSTPVWRAGPFGHKTLCNACGVRWMKASKGSKK